MTPEQEYCIPQTTQSRAATGGAAPGEGSLQGPSRPELLFHEENKVLHENRYFGLKENGPEGTPGKPSWESRAGPGQGVRETAAGKKSKEHGGTAAGESKRAPSRGTARAPPALRGQRAAGGAGPPSKGTPRLGANEQGRQRGCWEQSMGQSQENQTWLKFSFQKDSSHPERGLQRGGPQP